MDDMIETETDSFKPLLKDHSASGSVLKIKLNEYNDKCPTGCCLVYGTITTVNGIELPCHNQDAETILKQVLEHLGYVVEIVEPE